MNSVPIHDDYCNEPGIVLVLNATERELLAIMARKMIAAQWRPENFVKRFTAATLADFAGIDRD